MFRVRIYSLCLTAIIFLALGDYLNAQNLGASPRRAEAICYNNPTSPIYGDHSDHCPAYHSPSGSPPVTTDCVSDELVGAEYFQSPDEVARNPWFVRMGVGVLLFGESSTLRINDVVVPEAGLDISNATTFAFDIGYQLSPFWSVTLSAGVPPRLDLDGTGIFAGASYGTTLFAPVALTAQRYFHVTRNASIYAGAGINYNAQYESKDGLIQNLDIENDAAVILQLGVERRINHRINLFADAKKAFYRTQAFGNSGPASVRSDVTVNPTVLVFGLRYNF